uniref:Uncharacterized protein n=1 Tax=Solibacter usitatus (strain Ellin6076) TaxID=234267 RepID=Q02BR1_SOLUE
MDEIKHTPGHGPGHETADINVWAIGKFGIGLVAICVVSIVLLLGLFKYFQSQEESATTTKIEPRRIFPQPQLQQTPVLDLRAIRAEEDQVLNSYAWIDQPKGVVRIPISQAIDLLASRGLPSRGQPGAQSAAGNVSVPTESGLGIKAMGEESTEASAPPPAAEQKSVVGPNKGQPEQVNTKEVQRK